MTIDFENEQELTFDFNYEDTAKLVIETVLDQEQCPYEVQVSLLLTDEEAIRKANREFRGIDRATDVLSFPMVDFPAPASYDFLESEDTCFHPETGELLLGDIVISIPRALEQSREYGHSIKREYAFLIAHSTLHLLGYDHIDDTERLIMEEKQEKALHTLGIERI